MKDKRKIYDNGRIRIIDEHQLLIEDTILSDEGNYSCLAISLGETRYSPVAHVKIKGKKSIFLSGNLQILKTMYKSRHSSRKSINRLVGMVQLR